MTPGAESLYRKYANLPGIYAHKWDGVVRDQDMHELEAAGFLALAGAAIHYEQVQGIKFSTLAIRSILKKVRWAAIDCLKRRLPPKSFEGGTLPDNRIDHALIFEYRDTIEDLLSEVSEEDAAILVDHFMNGATSEEVGRSLGITASAVRMRAWRAVEQIRVYLARKGEKVAC